MCITLKKRIPTMARFPQPKFGDIDDFERRLGEALSSNSPGNIASGLTRALRYIEDQAENHGLEMTYINNATSTAARSFIEMQKRLALAEEQLKTVEEWATGDVVTAETEFGNGYRECQRGLRDKLGIKSDEPSNG